MLVLVVVVLVLVVVVEVEVMVVSVQLESMFAHHKALNHACVMRNTDGFENVADVTRYQTLENPLPCPHHGVQGVQYLLYLN